MPLIFITFQNIFLHTIEEDRVEMKKLIYYSGDILSVKGCKLCKKKTMENTGGGDLLLV